MSSSVVFVNVLDVRWECEKGFACVRGAMRATIATLIEAIFTIGGDMAVEGYVLRLRAQDSVAVDNRCQQ